MYPSRNSMGSTKISACGSLPLYSWMRKLGEQVSSWTAAAAATGPTYCGSDHGVARLGHHGDFLGFEDAAALADVELDDLGGLLLEESANSYLVARRSPEAIGMLVCAATRAISSTFSGGTGSSNQKGSNSSRTFATRIAPAVLN